MLSISRMMLAYSSSLSRSRSRSAARVPTSSDDAGLRALIETAVAGPLQPLATLRDEVVRRYVELAIARTGEDREAAAKALEIGVRTLYRYLA